MQGGAVPQEAEGPAGAASSGKTNAAAMMIESRAVEMILANAR